MSFNMKKFKEFFNKPDIQEALNDNDINYIYDRFEVESDGYTAILTAFFLEHGIHPIAFVRKQLFRQIYEDSLIENIVVHGKIELIGISAFLDCHELKTVILEDGVQEIKDLAFANCFKLESITIPESVRHIADNAFNNIPNSCIMYCIENSYAHKYCIEHEYKYELI